MLIDHGQSKGQNHVDEFSIEKMSLQHPVVSISFVIPAVISLLKAVHMHMQVKQQKRLTVVKVET